MSVQKKRKCLNFKNCVDKAMQFAEQNNYDDAIKSFLNDTKKHECTKFINNDVFTSCILNDSKNNLKYFRNALQGFENSCCCFCNKK